MDENTKAPASNAPKELNQLALDAGGHKIDANTYFLFIDSTGSGSTYDNVVCLINYNFAGTTATNDASTMCGPDSSPGDISATITLNGQTLLVPSTGFTSAPDLFDLWNNRDYFGWKISPGTPASGDITKTGEGYLSSYGENYDNGQKGQFSATITVAGPITQTIAP